MAGKQTALFCLAVCSLSLSAQTAGETAQNFAGCYELRIRSTSPEDKGLPQHFQLLSQPVRESTTVFWVKVLSADGDQWVLSRWKPRNRRSLTIDFSRGLGGYHVKLTDKKGSFVGAAKFWCDSRCAFPTPKLPVEAHRMSCEIAASRGK